ncbi:hypothetical protein QWY82_12605 [Simiduia curdlanivorans]|uniref:Imm11 family protein n=1 Tax=Simiduia curdlanivorans TaxID=1492769 RepID=A0ABV8V9X2_9GAMM|nr:hypothetical protein [Simiduia curdlanivorans]MDN3639637.1 hypothetical protein [Simiduia curdlanivorans]
MANAVMKSAIYKVDFDLDHYLPVGPTNIDDLDGENLWVTGEPKATTWVSVPLHYGEPEHAGITVSDISWLGPAFFTFNEKAAAVLRELLVNAGELLEANIAGERHYAFNPLLKKPCLDVSSSQYNIRKNGQVGRLLTPAIDPNKTDKAAVFQTPETYRTMLFVSGEFKQAYDKAALTGLVFTACSITN